MKTGIYYFSGAGNTECIAKIMAEIFKIKGYSVFRKRITNTSLQTIQQEYDILVTGFPVYFRRAPLMVQDFINRQAGHNRKFFTFCTKGLYSGNAAREIQILAKERSFKCSGHLEFLMPGSDALALMAKKNSLTEKIFKSIHSRNIRKQIEDFVKSIDNNAAAAAVNEIKAKWYTPFDNGIIKPLERYFTNNHQIFVNRFEASQSSCNLCRHCVHNCPNANIAISDNRVLFGSNCSVCLRCLHQCPQEAIEIRNKTENNVKYHPAMTKDLSVNFS